MSETIPPPAAGQRCPRCDTLNAVGAARCLGCGALLPATPAPAAPADAAPADAAPAASAPQRARAAAGWVEGAGNALLVLIVLAAVVWALLLRGQRPTPPAVAALATVTAGPAPTAIPTRGLPPTATPTSSPTATAEPTATPTPLPTATPQPPVDYRIGDGEVLFNIALRYDVSIESIIAANPGMSPDQIVAGQTIRVPLPTATPPLERVRVDLNGETVIADPTDCAIHTIAADETLFGIARRYDVPLETLLVMNRLAAERILRPGDTVCIPTVIYDTVATAEDALALGNNRPVIDRPRLLYPAADAAVSGVPVTLQWLAARPLSDNEFYMVEVTNLNDPAARPQRAFVRQTSWQVPDAWLPEAGEATLRWRVSYVQITGVRADGEVIYAYGGPASEAAFTLGAGSNN